MTFQGNIEDLQSAVVVDRTGDKLGKVSQLYLDNDTQQPSWVTVNTGLFGTHESFVPLTEASYSEGTLTVPYEKAFIKGAPTIAEQGELPREQEDELYSYYGLGGAAGDAAGGPGHRGDDRGHQGDDRDRQGDDRDRQRDDRAAATTDGGSVTLHEERANVGTERVATGKARLRKHVVTDTESVEVPVQREEVVLEREPADGRSGGTLSEEAVDVTLTEERPVVDKETVATENVSLGKRAVQDQETVDTDLAHEEVEIDGQTPRTGRPERDR